MNMAHFTLQLTCTLICKALGDAPAISYTHTIIPDALHHVNILQSSIVETTVQNNIFMLMYLKATAHLIHQWFCLPQRRLDMHHAAQTSSVLYYFYRNRALRKALFASDRL